MDKIRRNVRRNVSMRNKIVKADYIGKDGFSLIEIVFTIIIIGLAMGAITESFIAGSAKSVNIVNEETAVNVAKQEMAALNYCRNGGSVSGVCSAFNNNGSPNCSGSNQNTWDCPSSFYTPYIGPTVVNNECFYTKITASNVNFADTNGNGTINGSSNNLILSTFLCKFFIKRQIRLHLPDNIMRPSRFHFYGYKCKQII
ncbi:MAG: prepilin-type N-terminal cleavage/methylation domain-containing protein [Candidatus Acidulodesulfobacterium acidiphilum]|uniref:Prepilin-type N-terminal cleavage/methylation domain-containing protein n=1 Tax=Candidatus Acidulodesulfobacterium acidiphilum TaxID=2597224 RepID=A0A520X7A9_9DELT|nr:MAG: prepilin-type N-terminal cleavage/methylation domain-containing protein [Candidatus Acidulodesulfobacterium acidiphilum]